MKTSHCKQAGYQGQATGTALPSADAQNAVIPLLVNAAYTGVLIT
jgi:hypothetical protein